MSQAGNIYGRALYDLAREEGLSDRILQELTVLEQSFQEEPQFLRLLSASNISVEERCDIVDHCFRDNVHIYVVNFLKILTQKAIVKSYSACVRAFTELYNDDHGILPVTAVSAVALSPEQIGRLSKKLTEITGKKIQIINRVDPDCLGGVRLDYNGKRVDGSVANRLASVRNMLKNTVL